MRNIIPEPVFNRIARHIRVGVSHAEEGWDAGSDEEDTLTGDLGSALRRKQSTVLVGKEAWTWKVTYKKFRSKGANAEEKGLGADGLFQIEVENQGTGEITSKGLLFQAKKVGDRREAKLREQVTNIERLATNGGAIIRYGPNGYVAVPTSEFLELGEQSFNTPAPLADFFGGRFLECQVGTLGMYFDATRNRIVVPDSDSSKRHSYINKFNISHRIKIEVKKLSTPI